jgi:hypothetical protein
MVPGHQSLHYISEVSEDDVVRLTILDSGGTWIEARPYQISLDWFDRIRGAYRRYLIRMEKLRPGRIWSIDRS